MADLPGRPVVPEVDAAVDRDHAPDARAEGQPDERHGSSAGPEPQLRQAERPRVVDQRDRHTERGLDRRPDRPPGPLARHVHEESGRALDGVVQPGDADADRSDPGPAFQCRLANFRRAPDDRLGSFQRECRSLALVERAPVVALPLDNRPFEIRDAEIDPEVLGRERHVSPVTLVYAAATATMIAPNSTCRTASGISRTVRRVVRIVRISAPTIVPE